MPWTEAFAVFIVCHLAGDFLLQTKFQALYKRNGLSGGVALKALAFHTFWYTACFIPAFIWIAEQRGISWMLLSAGLVAAPHMLQDDGRLIAVWGRRIKGLGAMPRATDSEPATIYLFVDQSFHVLALFGVALLVGY